MGVIVRENMKQRKKRKMSHFWILKNVKRNSNNANVLGLTEGGF